MKIAIIGAGSVGGTLEAIDAGGLTVARLLEPFAMLWIHLMARRNLGRSFAFSLLRH